jgi:hypothetical protein
LHNNYVFITSQFQGGKIREGEKINKESLPIERSFNERIGGLFPLNSAGWILSL